MKISVVTVSFNSAKTIEDTLASVNAQVYKDVEHVIIDGGSTDDTPALIRRNGQRVTTFVSEPDKGIYDAMNKGVVAAKGDVICFLNSDDTFTDSNVLAEVADAFNDHPDSTFVYGDLHMIDASGKLSRHWQTGMIDSKGLQGQQIPHPALFIKLQSLRLLAPPFDPSYAIAADLKQQLILINQMQCQGTYLPRPLVRMKLGGASTNGLMSYARGWRESRRAYNEVFGGGGTVFTMRKVFRKLSGLNPQD